MSVNSEAYSYYVIQTLKSGSLTAAAKELSISQPALSQAINALEKELGIRIFNRKAKPITLTDEGKLYYSYICRSKAVREDFLERLQNLKDEKAGSLTVGAPNIYMDTMVCSTAAQLCSEHPGYSVNLKSAPVETLIKMTLEGEIDCFVGTEGNIPENLERIFVKEERVCVCAAATKVLSTDPSGKLIPASLDGEKIIFLEPDQPMQKQIGRYLATHRIGVENRIVVDQITAAVNLVSCGAGLCFVPDGTVSGIGLKTYPTDIPTRKVYVFYNKDLIQTVACSDFITLLASQYKNHSITEETE